MPWRSCEKAIAEQTNHPRNGLSAYSNTGRRLRWAYAGALVDAGRTEEALRSAVEIARRRRETSWRISNEMPAMAPRNRSWIDLREILADRCGEFVPRCVAAGKKDVALRYLELQQRAAEPLLDRRPDLLASAAQMYEKLERHDLALDIFVRVFATQMNPSTRDQIVRLARRPGRTPTISSSGPGTCGARDAKPAYRFALVTADGQPMKLADVKARADPRQLLLSNLTRLQCGVSATAAALRQVPVARVHDGGHPGRPGGERPRRRMEDAGQVTPSPCCSCRPRTKGKITPATTMGYWLAPTDLLLDGARKVVFRHLGASGQALEVEIRELLGLPPFEGLEQAGSPDRR